MTFGKYAYRYAITICGCRSSETLRQSVVITQKLSHIKDKRNIHTNVISLGLETPNVYVG